MVNKSNISLLKFKNLLKMKKKNQYSKKNKGFKASHWLSRLWCKVVFGILLWFISCGCQLEEITSPFFGTYSAFSFILLSLVFATPLCCAIFPQKRLVHCIIGWNTFQFNFLKLKTPKHCSWNCAGLLFKPFIQLLP